MNKEQAKKLYKFIFHVNLQGGVDVTTRDEYPALFSDRDKVITFSDFDSAVDILLRTGGDREKIESLINKK